MSVSVFKRGVFKPGRTDGMAVKGDISRVGPQGQASNRKVSSTEVAMTGGAATVVGTGLLLAKKRIIGITGRVLVTVAGASLTSLNIGDGSDADRYGATIGLTAGTTFDMTSATADPGGFQVAAGNIVVTAVGGVAISSGSIRFDVHYEDLTAPTS